MPYKRLGFFILFSISISALPLWADSDSHRNVDSVEKLNLLNQATGGPAASNNYQARLDALFSPTDTPQRNSIDRQDEAARQNLVNASVNAQEDGLIEADLNPSKDNDQLKDKTKVNDLKVRDSKVRDEKVNASEDKFRKSIEELQKEADELKKHRMDEDAKDENKKPEVSENLPPSLANNPFYVGNSIAEKKSFDDNKPIIVSRLMQKGYSEDDAMGIVGEASSNEEIIITLMQKEGYSYGDAQEIVKTSD